MWTISGSSTSDKRAWSLSLPARNTPPKDRTNLGTSPESPNPRSSESVAGGILGDRKDADGGLSSFQ
ncbi:hypothetical protein PGTUg99_035545 [Puccinia graminis f. sp. tritici]|uniref:Uncharacterized protein n=1 Tax=Puccinia graminis f. sp. tritici TaxID=56615 RepID=A0A5B0Q9D6_PUCGR|nr:hypothetical protein PGTUg99_035545 [Puccinia graminis f. sp. tritici]